MGKKVIEPCLKEADASEKLEYQPKVYWFDIDLNKLTDGRTLELPKGYKPDPDNEPMILGENGEYVLRFYVIPKDMKRVKEKPVIIRDADEEFWENQAKQMKKR